MFERVLRRQSFDQVVGKTSRHGGGLCERFAFSHRKSESQHRSLPGYSRFYRLCFRYLLLRLAVFCSVGVWDLADHFEPDVVDFIALVRHEVQEEIVP